MTATQPSIQPPKKTWVTPEIELISKDTIESGSTPGGPEGLPTGGGNHYNGFS